MDLKRAKAIGKLAVLFGTPLAVIFGLFSCGVYCGHQKRHAITSFEHDVLGLDVEVVPAEDKPADKGKPDADKEGKPDADAKEAKPTPTGDTSPKGTTETKAPEPTPSPTPQPQPAPTPAPQPTPQPDASDAATPPSVPEIRVDPLEGELARLHATPMKVRVEVLVHDDLVEHTPAWIDYVQRTVARASQVWQVQFGIELELVGVRRWSTAEDTFSPDQLLEDLEALRGPGADIVLGFSQRAFDDRVASQAAPIPEAFNGTAAVVYATPGHRDAHLRTLLYEVARLFGASAIDDPKDAAYTSGSWMSYAPVAEAQTPWIDATNRARVLERKQKPFAPATADDEEDDEP